MLYLVQKFALMRGWVSTDDPQDVAHGVVLCFYEAQCVRFMNFKSWNFQLDLMTSNLILLESDQTHSYHL